MFAGRGKLLLSIIRRVGQRGAEVADTNQNSLRYGFRRTECNCAFCRTPCRHMPGSLDVADLESLCPPGHDLFTWAEEHLRALKDKAFPTLVPARGPDGSCHWLYNEQCLVHAHAPYSCAFFDMHQSEAEVEMRSAATIRARQEDAAAGGLYFQVWRHLLAKGLVARPGDRMGLAEELRQLGRLNPSIGR